MVTCLYRGRAVDSVWSRLGAAFIDDWFAPSVRVAHAGGSRRFGFGATIALLAGTATAIWFANPQLGAVIAAAMVVNIFVAGVAGVAIPLLLDRLDQDPAVASSIFVTMTTDSMGFLAFLGLAVLSGLTTLA